MKNTKLYTSVKGIVDKIGDNKVSQAVAKFLKGYNDVNVKAAQFTSDLVKQIPGVGPVLSQIQDVAQSMLDGGKKVAKALGLNHDEWYLKDGPLELVGLDFSEKTGVINDDLEFARNGSNFEISVPKIMEVQFRIVPPRTRDDIWKASIFKIYNRLNRAAGGAVAFDQYDVDRYVLALAQMRGAWGKMYRAACALGNFSRYDNTLPEILFAAMGLDYEDWSKNVADVRESVDMWGKQLRELAPLKLAWFDRIDWLCQNIFADSNDAKAQLYLFNCDLFWFWNFDKNEWGVFQLGETWTSSKPGEPWADVYRDFNYIVNYFKANPTFAKIASTINTVYENEMLLNYPKVKEELTTVHDESVLTQIQNIKCLGDGYNDSVSFNLGAGTAKYSYVNYGVSGITGTNSLAALTNFLARPVINSPKNKMSAVELIKYTRFVPCLESEPSQASSWNFSTFGTEVVMECRAWLIKTTSDLKNDFYYEDLGFGFTQGASADALVQDLDNNFVMSTAWSAFDYAPQTVQAFSYTGSGTDIGCIMAHYFDWNNFAQVRYATISNYHSKAAASLLWIPARQATRHTVELKVT